MQRGEEQSRLPKSLTILPHYFTVNAKKPDIFSGHRPDRAITVGYKAH